MHYKMHSGYVDYYILSSLLTTVVQLLVLILSQAWTDHCVILPIRTQTILHNTQPLFHGKMVYNS